MSLAWAERLWSLWDAWATVYLESSHLVGLAWLFGTAALVLALFFGLLAAIGRLLPEELRGPTTKKAKD